MASVYRLGAVNLICNKFSTRLCKPLKKTQLMQVAFLSGKGRHVEYIKPAPFPYWRKKLGFLAEMMDPVAYRFDENSKIIVVDGPPAVGKSKLCESLADHFDMLYMPAPTYDDLYIDRDGVDLRIINKKLKLKHKLLDLELFHKYPDHPRMVTVQLDFLLMRLEQYLNALTHLMSTGQGIVLNRSVYSDSVFIDTMHECGYVSKSDHKFYKTILQTLYPLLLRPNVVVYLDVPVPKVLENIKRRGVPYEIESKLFNEKYLKTLENNYKNVFLKSIMPHAFVLHINWGEKPDANLVATELELLPLEEFADTTKQADWVFNTVSDLKLYRSSFHRDRYLLYNQLKMRASKIPDNFWSLTSVVVAQTDAIEELLGPKYAEGLFPAESKIEYNLMEDIIPVRIRRSPRDFIYRKLGPAE